MPDESAAVLAASMIKWMWLSCTEKCTMPKRAVWLSRSARKTVFATKRLRNERNAARSVTCTG